MKIKNILLPLLITFSMFVISCGQKDSDIKASVEEKLKTNADMGGSMTVSVADGVVTLSGQCKDEACRVECENLAKSVKGVKSVVNNSTVAATPAPVEILTDDALTTGVKDATKDHPTVTATVANGIITLTGELKRDQLPKLMQTLNTLNPVKIENQLTIK